MKKSRLIILMIALVLTFSLAGSTVASTSSTAPSTAGAMLDAVYEIGFDGYCDGMTINFDNSTGVTTGLYTSSCATCPFPEVIGGTGGGIVSQGPGFSLSWDPSFGMFTVIRTNRTWTHYTYDGGVFNQGTFSLCTEVDGEPTGLSPSTLK